MNSMFDGFVAELRELSCQRTYFILIVLCSIVYYINVFRVIFVEQNVLKTTA